MNTQFYTLRALSPLHAGAGDANFGIIDKHVQRDSLTDLPTIFASSLKGSLRQLLETRAATANDVLTIFGSSNAGGNEAGEDLRQGQYIFYQAKLLALPIRSSHDLYYLATSPPIIQELLDDLRHYQEETLLMEELRDLAVMQPDSAIYFGKDHQQSIQLEDLKATYGGAATAGAVFGDRLAVLPVNEFARLAKELPTIARNSLDNGISKNLWYEEVVPREARFYCPVSSVVDDGTLLDAALTQVNNLVQIGGNATVGYGLCEWQKMH